MKQMTGDERRIANAALGAGPWDNHDQIVIAVSDGLKLEPQRVEAVLQRLRIRMVLVCVRAANAASQTASASGTSGALIGWMRSKKLWLLAGVFNLCPPPVSTECLRTATP